MRKIIIIVMLGIAVPVYIYNAFILTGGIKSKERDESSGIKDSLDNNAEIRIQRIANRRVEFKEREKSPFAIREKKAAPVKKKPVVKKTPKKVRKKKKPDVKKPDIEITGIMWNPDNPVAMIKIPGHGSAAVKQGDMPGGGIKIKEIKRGSIKILYKDTEFTITK